MLLHEKRLSIGTGKYLFYLTLYTKISDLSPNAVSTFVHVFMSTDSLHVTKTQKDSQ